MSKHLPKTSKHLHDDDVKIWNGGEDKDVKIWRKARQEDAEAESDCAPSDGNISRRANGSLSRRGYRHDNALSVKRIALVVIAAAILTADMFLSLDGWLRLASFAVPFLIVGFDVMLDAVEKAADGDILSDCMVCSVAGIAAFSVGAYMEAVLIMLLYRLGELAIAYAEEKCWVLSQGLNDIRPKNANVETAEGVLSVGPEYVNEGDIIIIDPREKIALDGVIVEGTTALDISALTGDGEPVAVSVGSRVYSGSVNLTAAIKVRVTEVFALSTVNRVLRIAEAAKEKPSSYQRFAQGFCKYYKPAAVALALVLGIVAPLLMGDWAQWIGRAVVVLALSCCGGIMVSVSTAYSGGLGRAVRQGIFVKGLDRLGALSKTDTMVFDKTGTITEGRFAINEVCPVGMSERKLLTIAATAESCSDHPIAHSLREACGAVREDNGRAIQIQEIPGRGVCAAIGGKSVYVGNAALLEEHGIGYVVPSRSGAAIHVAVDNTYCGYILIQDRIRDGAFDALESLRVQGIKKMVMLTGDVLSVARPIASKLNFDMLRAELTPDEKFAALDYLVSNRGEQTSIAFVGDGVSDAAAIERADVGIAVGALGYESVFQTADIIIMDKGIKNLPAALRISKQTSAVAMENIVGILGVKLILLLLGAGGLIPMFVAIAGDALVIIAAIINSLRTMQKLK